MHCIPFYTPYNDHMGVSIHLSSLLTKGIWEEGGADWKGGWGIFWGDGDLGGHFSGDYNSQNSPHPTVKMCAFCYM